MNEETPTCRESRIWGPPGCGKTTYLRKQINNAAKKYGGSEVLVTSFTKAAATELASRDLRLPEGNVGTLHSHCYRALGAPEIADSQLEDWNRKHPGFRLSQTNFSVDEMFTENLLTTVGDDLYGKLQILRARMIPVESWPARVRRFAEAWNVWKSATCMMDFTDLLETALRDLRTAPNSPDVIMVDEAQDLSKLQLMLLRQWGCEAVHLVMAADDDQTIYGFAGAAPEVLLDREIPEAFRTVLKQSYRVPRAVHTLSQAWIQTVGIREAKEYFPRDADGEVRLLHKGNYKYVEPIVDDLEQYVGAGRTVMLLATCSYMLEPLKQVLRIRGLAFHNPYRLKRTDWNPLRPPHHGWEDPLHPRARGLSAAERLLAYLRPRPEVEGGMWNAEDLQAWAAWLKTAGGLTRGAEEFLKQLPPGRQLTPEVLLQLFPLETVSALTAASSSSLSSCMGWWLDHLKPPKRRTAEYPVRVVHRGGVKALRETPKIIIGTGHSVKGGEADVVYLLPDLSPSGTRNWEGRREDRDTVVRLAYVMMTRAREVLVLCEPATAFSVPIARIAARQFRSHH